MDWFIHRESPRDAGKTSLMLMNKSHVSKLVLLDLSNVVGHRLLLNSFHDIVGVEGTALQWPSSKLTNRTRKW